jgi:hypothetical protein
MVTNNALRPAMLLVHERVVYRYGSVAADDYLEVAEEDVDYDYDYATKVHPGRAEGTVVAEGAGQETQEGLAEEVAEVVAEAEAEVQAAAAIDVVAVGVEVEVEAEVEASKSLGEGVVAVAGVTGVVAVVEAVAAAVEEEGVKLYYSRQEMLHAGIVVLIVEKERSKIEEYEWEAVECIGIGTRTATKAPAAEDKNLLVTREQKVWAWVRAWEQIHDGTQFEKHQN